MKYRWIPRRQGVYKSLILRMRSVLFDVFAWDGVFNLLCM